MHKNRNYITQAEDNPNRYKQYKNGYHFIFLARSLCLSLHFLAASDDTVLLATHIVENGICRNWNKYTVIV